MMANDTQMDALRAVYKRRLLSTAITAAIFLVAAVLLLLRLKAVPPLAFFIAVCFGIVEVVAFYYLKRAMYRKGEYPYFLLYLFLLLPGIALAILLFCKVIPIVDGLWGFAYAPTYILLQPLIPLIQLLRDGILLRKGTPCRSVGRMKKNALPVRNYAARECYMLFEDESTHEVRLIRTESMSPTRRYRILYLPHVGLAVGEIIPDKVVFDSLGNVKRGKNALDKATKPTTPHDSRPDLNTPERQKAAKFGVASKVCYDLISVFLGLAFLAFIAMQSWSVPLVPPLGIFSFVAVILHGNFQDVELKLRCTEPTTARCVTFIKGGGRHSGHNFIVEYTVDGVIYTKALSIYTVSNECTIYYDPLEPETVRAR